jgi:two-component system response regulator DegU
VRILIVDDDHGFRVFIRRVLERERDWRIVGEAIDGEEAVRKTQKFQPDLVLMDMDLPGINGLEATRRVKASFPRIVVIMFSALEGSAYREAAARSGADEFLHKLEPLSKMLATIRKSSGKKAA